MLTLDLGRLRRRRRVEIAEDVPRDAALWAGTGLEPETPLGVRLEAQPVGEDVLVRGRFQGRFGLDCRRCLTRVHLAVDEEVSLLFRPGLERSEAEGQDVYTFGVRAHELDLSGALREQIMLAVPEFAVCREACRGLCPRCGVNLNEETCRCEPAEPDERWAALRKLRQD